MSVVIRPAAVTDAEGMLDIYTPIVRSTAISFELEPPTLAEFRERIAAYSRTAPWLVCERDGKLAGYAYATPFRARPAYQWSIETTVYVSDDCQRRGVARTLYSLLLDLLARQGFMTAVGVIVLPNAASVALHESLGFSCMGFFPKIGFKHGAWHDTGWWIKPLCSSYKAPCVLGSPAETLDMANREGLFKQAELRVR